MLLLQPQVVADSTLERVLNVYGWPMLVLVIIVLVFWRVVWPRITRHLDKQESIADEARKAMTDRATQLQAREDTLMVQFKESIDGLKETLDVVGKRSEAQIRLLEQVVDGVKTLKRSPRTRKATKSK